MGMIGGGWSGINSVNGSWTSRSMCSREPIRYAPDCRLIKVNIYIQESLKYNVKLN